MKNLLDLYPDFDTIHGPYFHTDGSRQIICLYSKQSGKKKTISYPKAIMEVALGRLLSKDETVDHIDNDPLNNSLENLQVMTIIENVKKSWKDGLHPPTEFFHGVCDECGITFKKKMRQVKHNRKQGKKGPFCSKSCAGKASHRK